MIFVLAIIVIFVAVSIYFFFKAEALQRELLLQSKALSVLKKENRNHMDLMAIIAQRYEEITVRRFVELRTELPEKLAMFDIIAPMINNYAAIINDSVQHKGELQSSVKKVYEGYQKGSYKGLTNYINQADKEIKRAWASNNLNGFIILVEALIKVNKP